MTAIKTPAPVLDYLQKELLEKRFPAYLQLSTDGRVVAAGGSLDRFGLGDMKPGSSADQSPLLSGLSRANTLPLFLPCVELEGYTPADIHIFASPPGTWILLLDASAEQGRQMQLHQLANEVNLLRKRTLRDQGTSWDLTAGPLIAVEQRELTLLAVAPVCALDRSGRHDCRQLLSAVEAQNRRVSHLMAASGGIVVSSLGETMLAAFGWSTAASPAAALAMKTAIGLGSGADDEFMSEDKVRIPARVGVASGTVVIRTRQREGEAAIECFGEPVARAFCLLHLARKQGILLDQRSVECLGWPSDQFVEIRTLKRGGVFTRTYRYRGD